MELEDVWPLFSLSIETPRLSLRPVRDDDLPGLVTAALEGVHDPGRMPFGYPWTDAEPTELARSFAAYHWGLRARLSRSDWAVAFAIVQDGVAIGIQELAGYDFRARRTVNSGSWLTRRLQGRGLGTEARAGLLLFAFDHLGAEWAESGAASWNAASLAVSRKLGYEPNGVTRVHPRPGEVVDEQKVRLSAERFARPTWSIAVRGADAAHRQLGIVEEAA
jgi:RimJ/RimL family protein N-acetyltransferase